MDECICMYVCMHACVHLCMYVRTCIHACMYVMYVCMYACVYVCTHGYMYIFMRETKLSFFIVHYNVSIFLILYFMYSPTITIYNFVPFR